MKKLFQKGILLLTSFFLTSCSNPFFGGGEGSSISEVTHVYDDKSGNTIVTIRFVDEDLEPVTFVISRGITGQDGNGIRNIKAVGAESAHVHNGVIPCANRLCL